MDYLEKVLDSSQSDRKIIFIGLDGNNQKKDFEEKSEKDGAASSKKSNSSFDNY